MMQEAASSCVEIEASETASLQVLAVVPGDMKGSSFVFARRQISALVSLGVNVRNFNFTDRTSLKGLFREWQRLRREIRLFQPDIVHAHYGTITALLSALAFPRRLVITYRGSDLNGSPGTGFLRRYAGIALSQLAALRADAIICVSSRLRQKLWWQREKASILPDGVDMRLFCPGDKNRARGILGWSEQERVVLFNAGKEPKVKGLALAERALKVATRLLGPVRLVILNGNVSPEEVPTYINAADCVLLCSLSEGSPNIVKEALACDVPVVALNVGDVAELLAGVFPSALTSERDPEQLGAALAGVLRLEGRCNGRQMVASVVSEDHTAKVIRDIYKGLTA